MPLRKLAEFFYAFRDSGFAMAYGGGGGCVGSLLCPATPIEMGVQDYLQRKRRRADRGRRQGMGTSGRRGIAKWGSSLRIQTKKIAGDEIWN
jgi:hypothetical protein